ncbi:MAG: hydroxymyristoyl-ACP dehydratase [Rubrivivax sp.]
MTTDPSTDPSPGCGYPATLDAAGIRARIPHQGRMALLQALLDWSDSHIRCSLADHRAADHPLRQAGGLLSACAVEFAGQAMALHAALRSDVAGARDVQGAAPGEPRAGFLASARGITLHAPRLDDAPGPLVVRADRVAGDQRQAIYRFELHDADARLLVEGRCTVVLDGTPATSP